MYQFREKERSASSSLLVRFINLLCTNQKEKNKIYVSKEKGTRGHCTLKKTFTNCKFKKLPNTARNYRIKYNLKS